MLKNTKALTKYLYSCYHIWWAEHTVFSLYSFSILIDFPSSSFLSRIVTYTTICDALDPWLRKEISTAL